MRCRYHCTLIVFAGLVMAMTSFAEPAKPSLTVTNNSMEEVAANAKLPTGYVPWGDPGLVQVDSTVAFEGKQSVKLILRGYSATFGIYQSVPTSVPEGMKCRFRVRVRTHDLDGQAYLMVYRYPPPFTPGEPYYSTRRISGTQDWTTIEVIVPAKKDGNLFQVFMLTTGTWGRSWWDNLEASVEEQP